MSIDVSVEDARTICEVFGVAAGNDPAKAGQVYIEALAKAALDEYLVAATGRQYPSSVRDLRELRLRLLAKHLGHLPSDAQVAEIFQLTRSQAKGLVVGARARYRRELGELLREAARTALRGADKVDDNHVRITAPDSLARFIDDLVANTTAAAPTKLTESSQRYDVPRRTVDTLCDVLGMQLQEVKNLPPKK